MTSKDTINTNLCRGLRACGIPAPMAHNVLNEITKWRKSSGDEWTVARIKALRQWYETYLTGCPEPPEWFRHSKDGMPLGIWSRVFRLPVGKALGVLSASTAFVYHPMKGEPRVTETQWQKFCRGTDGNQQVDKAFLDRLLEVVPHPQKYKDVAVPPLEPADLGIIGWNKSFPNPRSRTGVDAVADPLSAVFSHFKALFKKDKKGLRKAMEKPTREQKQTAIDIRHKQEARRLVALQDTWASIPQVTFDFLLLEDRYDILPVDVLGNDVTFQLNREHCKVNGRIGVVQEPELKARIIANPNRVLQHTLEPLKTLLMEIDRRQPSCGIFDQEEAMMWVQRQLKAGHYLSCCDLTSASDLLDVQQCFRLIEATFGINDRNYPGYSDYRNYYLAVSRQEWSARHLGWNRDYVSWKQGNPLGLGPSIFILDLVNQAAAMAAARDYRVLELPSWPGKHCQEYFRTIGDDIVMCRAMRPYYERVIRALGGEINASKCLESDRVAEFAGRVITTSGIYLKKVNYRTPGDNSFMSYVSQLGPQAKGLLRPRQRKVWESLEPVPGVIVPGPYSQDSFGEPLARRYQWYLEEILPLQEEEPDPQPELLDQQWLHADLAAQEVGTPVREQAVMPFLGPADYPSAVPTKHRVGGDPRLAAKGGKTLLKSWEEKAGRFQPYDQWTKTSDPYRKGGPATSTLDFLFGESNKFPNLKRQLGGQTNEPDQANEPASPELGNSEEELGG